MAQSKNQLKYIKQLEDLFSNRKYLQNSKLFYINQKIKKIFNLTSGADNSRKLRQNRKSESGIRENHLNWWIP